MPAGSWAEQPAAFVVAEINLDTQHKEFSEWRWMPLRDLPAAAIEFKREVYEAVVADFAPLIDKKKQLDQPR